MVYLIKCFGNSFSSEDEESLGCYNGYTKGRRKREDPVEKYKGAQVGKAEPHEGRPATFHLYYPLDQTPLAPCTVPHDNVYFFLYNPEQVYSDKNPQSQRSYVEDFIFTS